MHHGEPDEAFKKKETDKAGAGARGVGKRGLLPCQKGSVRAEKGRAPVGLVALSGAQGRWAVRKKGGTRRHLPRGKDEKGDLRGGEKKPSSLSGNLRP